MPGAVVDPLFDPEVVEDPHAYYAHLREADPVHQIQGTGTFVVTRMDHIREAVARTSDFSSVNTRFLHVHGNGAGPGLRGVTLDAEVDSAQGTVLATADPPDHGRQRKVVTRCLSQTVMQGMEPEFREVVDQALDPALTSGRIEWMGELAEPLPMVMVARILGLPDDKAADLKDQGYASVEAIGGFVTDERLAELGTPMMNVGPVVDRYLESRGAQAYEPNTLIGVCAQAAAAGELTDLESFAILFLLVSAGGESTTSLTGTGARILAERPDLQERLRREPRLIPAFVEEACRVEPPFRGHYRAVVTDAELGGVPIPAGSSLLLAWPAANRDRRVFANADDIDLDRPNPRQHVGFGWGIHLCVGAPLARVEAKVAFEQLLARTKSFSIAPDAAPLHHHKSLMVRRLVDLPLVLEAAK